MKMRIRTFATDVAALLSFISPASGLRGAAAGGRPRPSSAPMSSNAENTPVDLDTLKIADNSESWRRRDLFGKSLVDETLGGMDTEQKTSFASIKKQKTLVSEERRKRRRVLSELGVPPFLSYLRSKQVATSSSEKPEGGLHRRSPTILQLNVGLYCNQACAHCHVESSPLRKNEMMKVETVAKCLELLVNTPSISTLDITGGAPELNSSFRYLVRLARSLRPDLEIIDRCNLTVLQEPGQEDLIDFLKEHRVRIVASLPCYSEENVRRQRGSGVFDRSIAALIALNEAGYGLRESNHRLDLVYNPLGAFLPPEQSKLQAQYKVQLMQDFGIQFHELFTITNMPIKRFADFLYRRGELKTYMDLLVQNFNLQAVEGLMCLDMVSVGYDGAVYDCDFNQQLQLAIGGGKGLNVLGMVSYDELSNYPIRTDSHCFGCTAGMGSS